MIDRAFYRLVSQSAQAHTNLAIRCGSASRIKHHSTLKFRLLMEHTILDIKVGKQMICAEVHVGEIPRKRFK